MRHKSILISRRQREEKSISSKHQGYSRSSDIKMIFYEATYHQELMTTTSSQGIGSFSGNKMARTTNRRTKATSSLLLTSVILIVIALIEPPQLQDQHRHHLKLVKASTLIDSIVSSNNINNATASHQTTSTTATISSAASRSSTKHLRQHIQASFATPNQAVNITHVTYDALHDTIYLGATNTIYQLNGSDLTVQYEQSTGPVLDNPSCGVTECHGFEDYMKPTQNVNKILVIDYKHKKLLSCGSTKQGACRRYQLNNIALAEDLIPMAVAANDDNSSTYAFIAPARYTYDPSSTSLGNSGNGGSANAFQQQQVLYVASTYTKIGQSRELLVPAIGTRTLDDGPNLLKLYENSLFDGARIDINSHLRDYFLVNYVYGFASSNYIYFITVQKKATSRDFEELGYHTRLARICITDSSYNSYTEVDLKCVPNRRKQTQQQHNQQRQGSSYFNNHQQQVDQPSDYPLLQDAIFVDAGSQLLQSLAQTDQLSSNYFANSASTSPDDNKVLLGVFSSARDHTQQAGDHSALCAFSLAQIEDKFNDNIHSCYTGRMQSRNMEYIAGNVQECPKSGQGGNVVNFCHETLKINGTIPIVSEASIQYYNTTLTAITATSHINTQAKNIYSEQLASELAINSANVSFSSGKKDSSTSGSPFNNGAMRQNTVVFAGTSNGHIKKILLNNATNAIEFEDTQVDTTSAILSDLHIHSSGHYLIAATPYKVLKVATHNCGQYASCRECSQSRNPYCGWCLLKKSCTTRSECAPNTPVESFAVNLANQQQLAGKQPKWISAEATGKCIDLQSIVPDKIPMTSTGKVDLYIDRLPRLPSGHQYKCIFNRSEQTSASQTAFGLSCPLPKLIDRARHIQIEPGRDHAVVELAVRSSETNTDFLDGRITFFDCQRHTTCKDCLTTNWGCNWCLNENVCLFNTSKCDKTSSQQQVRHQQQDNSLLQMLGQQLIVGGGGTNGRIGAGPVVAVSSNSKQLASSNTIGQVQQCPTFDVGHQQDILIADGSEKELSIRVKNMPQFKGAIKCVVEIENFEISLKAQIREDRVICENANYTYAADVGLLNGQLKVIYSDNNIHIDRTNFTLYKCHLLGSHLNRPDCSLCQRIDSRFQCAWCSGSCRHKSRCHERPDERCPPPRIDFVHPLSGPALGGTRVTIEGSNLGQSFEEIATRVSIGNVPCKPIEEEYRPSNRIVCFTSPVMARHNHQPIVMHTTSAVTSLDLITGDVVVGNKAGYSIGPAKFQFKSIYLRDHQPRYGPQSGGTRLVLSGMNLDIGSNVQVFLDELPCLIEPNSITSEQLICRTSASRQPSRAIRHLKLVIDDAQIIRDDDVFYYTADPLIHKITPSRAYLSGGRPINVFGANLTVVQQPRMVIHDAASGKRINESLCILQDDTRMQCPSPAVNLQMMDLEYSEQNAASTYDPNGQSIFSSTSSTSNSKQVQVLQQDETVRFKLSFVMDNVQQLAYPMLQHDIAYTSDPRLYAFSSAQYKAAQEMDQAITSINGGDLSSSNSGGEQQTYQIESDTFLLPPGEPQLVLYGEHLRAALSEYEITVTVGQDLCNLTLLTQTKLVCLMPLDHMATPTDEEAHQTQRALPLVVVRIGFNLRYELGYVQYHPLLVEQIVSLIANSSSSSPYATNSIYSTSSSSLTVSGSRRLMHPAYPQYMPRESESILHKVSIFVGNLLMLVAYALMAFILVAFVYSGVRYSLRLKNKAFEDQERRQMLSKMDQLERSIRDECRVASLALQGDLNELERHVDLSGVPLLNIKGYIMKVFFPGMNNHPLLLRPNQHNQQQQHQAIKPSTTNDFPMQYFERLIFCKPFLISFINTLEKQPSFTIRDKVNVASLLMIVLMERLDYATDVMKTLLFQLVERSVAQLNDGLDFEHVEQQEEGTLRSKCVVNGSKLTRRASNLLNGLPIVKRNPTSRVPMKPSSLGKFVGGSASNLMHSMLARVGHKTSPLQSEQPASYYQHQQPISTIDSNQLMQANQSPEYMSTTTFNNQSIIQQQQRLRRSQSQNLNAYGGSSASSYGSSSVSRTRDQRQARREAARNKSRQAQLMLRRTDSVVEKMLTNWLALNMYEHFHGQAGQSLYMLFEALKCQLERGPIDSVSGDAYFSLNQHKLLREPQLHFEVVSLYVIVDTDILQPDNGTSTGTNNNNLLLDNLYEAGQRSFVSSTLPNGNRTQQQQQQSYTSGNTITLALRVLDCDSISQVKGKILNALYRNSPSSYRLTVNEVGLSLRQHQPMMHTAQTLSMQQQQQQFVTIVLDDEDFTSISAFNGLKRVNTLRHYGVNDQGIMMLKRNYTSGQQQQQQQQTSMMGDMLDDHYSNPYTEIQYGQSGVANINHQPDPARMSSRTRIFNGQRQGQQQQLKAWHLIRATGNGELSAVDRTSGQLSDLSSSPASHSPSMMLLGNQHQQMTSAKIQAGQFYHPSSSSTSSAGNGVLDTNSTSMHSSSLMNNQQQQQRQPVALDQQQQPIYCQIGSVAGGLNGSSYYCQINNQQVTNNNTATMNHNQQQQTQVTNNNIYLKRMLTSKGTIQKYIEDFFKTILTVRRPAVSRLAHMEPMQLYEDAAFSSSSSSGVICDGTVSSSATNRRNGVAPTPASACPSAVKWIFDLLDEAAIRNGISDQNVIHAWKSNAFLLRFWVNFVKNPNYILDVEKSSTLDASLSVIAQTLMDSCETGDQKHDLKGDIDRLIFAKDLPKYKDLVKGFYQDVASMRPVSDQDMVKQMNLLGSQGAAAAKFDTNLALKELCVYAVNYGGEIMNTLNGDYTCQQLELSQQLEQCFRSFTIFEAYQ